MARVSPCTHKDAASQTEFVFYYLVYFTFDLVLHSSTKISHSVGINLKQMMAKFEKLQSGEWLFSWGDYFHLESISWDHQCHSSYLCSR